MVKRGGHCLLHEAVEQKPASAGGAPVEPEGELVEVGVEVLGVDRPLDPVTVAPGRPRGQRLRALVVSHETRCSLDGARAASGQVRPCAS